MLLILRVAWIKSYSSPGIEGAGEIKEMFVAPSVLKLKGKPNNDEPETLYLLAILRTKCVKPNMIVLATTDITKEPRIYDAVASARIYRNYTSDHLEVLSEQSVRSLKQ